MGGWGRGRRGAALRSIQTLAFNLIRLQITLGLFFFWYVVHNLHVFIFLTTLQIIHKGGYKNRAASSYAWNHVSVGGRETSLCLFCC